MMTRRIKFSLITFVTALLLFIAGLCSISMPTTMTSAATSVTLSNFSIGATNAQNHVQLVAGSGEMSADFVTYGQSNNLAMIDTNGSTFGKVSMWREDTMWWGIVGVLAADSKTFNIFPPSGQAVLGDHLMIPQGAVIATDTDSVTFGEQVDLWYNGASWQMTEPVVLTDFTFGTNNVAGYFDIVPMTGSIPDAIVSSGANLSIASGTFGNSSTWTRDSGATTVAFPGQVGVLASATQNFQIFPSGATAAAGDVITIPQGATIIVNGYCVVFGETITVTFNGTKWKGLGEYEAPSTPMTISALESNSTYNGTMYQLYVTVDVSATATWAGWDNSATVVLNGNETKADGWCFNNTHSLYVQLTTTEEANPLTLAAGTILTINNTRYKIANDFNVYYYDGALHTEAKPTATPMTITGIANQTAYDSTNGWYGIYVTTNITNTGATWGGWDNSATVSVNGTATRADWCFASDVLLYVQVATTEVANPITFVQGTQLTINGTLYEISADFSIYHYDDGFHTEEKAEAISMTLTGLGGDAKFNTETNAYQLYITMSGVTAETFWANWDHNAKVLFNGVEMATAGWCFHNATTLYVEVRTAEVANPLTIQQGTQLTINGTLYEIANSLDIYYYSNTLHTEPKPDTTSLTLGALQDNSTFNGNQYALYIGVNVEAAATWAGWDNDASVILNGNTKVADGWCFSDVSVLYVQVSSTEIAQPLTIAQGTLLTINDTLYEVANDFNVSYYAVTKTVGDETTTVYESRLGVLSGEFGYDLPEISVSGQFGLGWIYEGALYKEGSMIIVPAEGFEIEAVTVEFTQLEGASIRIGSDLNGSGIRFSVKLSEFNDYIDYIGMLVMPVDLMTNGELTHDNYEVDTDCLEFAGDSSEAKLENYQDCGEGYYLKASVTKLYESNYVRTFAGRAFMYVNFADGEEYVYVDYDAAACERRICDVAKAALADEEQSFTDAQKATLRSYAIDELISYAYFGPTSTSDFANYKNTGMDVVWLDMVAYRYHERYQNSWTEEQETYMYNNATDPTLDLKGAFAAAKAQGLKVIVYDMGIRRLSESKIPLIAEDPANPQLLGLWLQTAETETAEVLGADADESYFDEANMTYTYSGSSFAGTNKAKVLKYLYQFENEAALKEYIATFMGQYAKESNFYGVMLADEPTEDMYESLALVKKIIAELYPNAYTQSCQLPSYYYSSFDTFKTTFESYASQVAGNGDLGLDFYPFLDEEISIWDQIFGKDTATEDGVRVNWLATMQYVAQTAAKYDLDFENTVQSHAMSEGYTAVSSAELALQVHLSLAFGADKLSYFTYNGHDEGGLTMTQYINNDATLKAAVTSANKNGDYMKRYMTGFEYSKSKLYGTSSNCLNTDNFTQSTLTNEIISSASNSLLVNEFYNEYTGEYGYYLVNVTVPDNATSVTVSLSGAATVYQNGASASTSSITLAAGEGVFIIVS